MRKQKNKEKGITLIALVVTIIVLIILAGVSISMIVGDNGIITQAQRAKQETEQARQNEEKSLKYLEASMQELITGEVQAYPVDDDTPGELDGAGTSTEPFKVESIEDLVALSNIVNTGSNNGKVYTNNTFSGEYIELTQTLDFNYDGSYALENSLEPGGLKDRLVNGEFEAIGDNYETGNLFLGTFNGNANTIKNIYMKSKKYNGAGGAAIFGFTSGTIKNLNTIANFEAVILTEEQQGIGGISAMNFGTIENCNTKINVYGDGTQEEYFTIGGIVGANYGSINKCYSNININNLKINYCSIGGIAGENLNSIYNCISEGNIKCERGKDGYVVIGGVNGINSGIAINHFSNITISLTDNLTGDVLNNCHIGGVVGETMISDDNSQIVAENRKTANCYFNGRIEINKNQDSTSNISVGGIIGTAYGTTVENCYSKCTLQNIGSVNVNLYTGIGYAYNNAIIRNCRYIGGEYTILQDNCKLENNQVEDLTDSKVVQYMNSYVDSSSEGLERWSLSGFRLQFE